MSVPKRLRQMCVKTLVIIRLGQFAYFCQMFGNVALSRDDVVGVADELLAVSRQISNLACEVRETCLQRLKSRIVHLL